MWTAAHAVPGSTISLCYDEDTTWENNNEHWITIDQIAAIDGSGSYDWNSQGVAAGTYYLCGYMYHPSAGAVFSHIREAFTIERKYEQEIFHASVFNWLDYLSFNPDLPANGIDTEQEARDHWRDRGVREGRRASYMFHSVYYLETYPDLKAAFANDYLRSIIHYVTTGIGEGRRGSESPAFVLGYPSAPVFDMGAAVPITWTAAHVVPGSTISLCYDEDTTWGNNNEHWITIDQIAAIDGAASYNWNTQGVAAGTYYLCGYMYHTVAGPIYSHLGQAIMIEPYVAVPVTYQRIRSYNSAMALCISMVDPYSQQPVQLGCNDYGGGPDVNTATIRVPINESCHSLRVLMYAGSTLVRSTSRTSDLPYMYFEKSGNTITAKINDNNDTRNTNDLGSFADAYFTLTFPSTAFAIENMTMSCN